MTRSKRVTFNQVTSKKLSSFSFKMTMSYCFCMKSCSLWPRFRAMIPVRSGTKCSIKTRVRHSRLEADCLCWPKKVWIWPIRVRHLKVQRLRSPMLTAHSFQAAGLIWTQFKEKNLKPRTIRPQTTPERATVATLRPSTNRRACSPSIHLRRIKLQWKMTDLQKVEIEQQVKIKSLEAWHSRSKTSTNRRMTKYGS